MSYLINVVGLRPVRDPDYRYQTEPISVRNEGKGKGRTLLTNITTIAKYIKRDHSEIVKFFGLVFGAQTFDEPNNIGLKGFHTADEFQRAFCTYVEYFVLCPGCRYPCETTYKVSKTSIYQMCDCCGTRSKIDPAQGKIVSKMITIIMAASQKKMEDMKKEPEKKDRKSSRVVEVKLSSISDLTKSTAEIVSFGPSSMPMKFKATESCQAVDTSGDESETAPTMIHEELTDEQALEEAIVNYRQWEAAHSTMAAMAKVEKLKEMQTLSSLPPISRPFLYLGAVFSYKDLGQVMSVLKTMATSSIQQGWILQAFVWYFATLTLDNISLKNILSKLWMTLYENDVIEEEVFLNWEMEFDSISPADEFLEISKDQKMSILEASSVFLTWLKEAEEEGEEED